MSRVDRGHSSQFAAGIVCLVMTVIASIGFGTANAASRLESNSAKLAGANRSGDQPTPQTTQRANASHGY